MCATGCFVKDHCKGMTSSFIRADLANLYIGGSNERSNNEIAATICELLDQTRPLAGGDSYKKLITFVNDRAGA